MNFGLNSIRRNLLAALLGAIFVVILLGGWATYLTARDEVGSMLDYQLQQVALSLRDQPFEGPAEALANNENLDYVIRVWNQSGLSVYYSKPHETLPELTRLGYSTADTSEAEWRVYAIQHHGLTIAVAQPMTVRNQLAASAAWHTLKPFFVLLPVLGVLIWFIVSMGLKPLARLAQSVQARSPDSLSPLVETGVPEEAQPLVLSLNDLLARLKSALDAQRALVADAAHELRTPLTALQLQVQLVERASSAEARSLALSALHTGLQRAIHAVQQLLTLARQEPGAAEYRPVTLSLAQLVRDVVVEQEGVAEAKGLDLGVTQADEAALVSGDREALRILLANLVGNALRYTPTGGRVDVSCGLGDGEAFVAVDDSGPGIPVEDRERVFDRFYRGNAEGEIGSGLGLSIVRAIAERHQARVELGDSDAGGLRAKVCFALVK